ncbi:ABC transporter B family member 26, chloroplastic [Glycine max]|nr:ABC transporter B family member 26, chloroplastic [Glycine max]
MPLLLSRTPPSSFPLTPLRNARAPLITPSQKRFTLAATRIVLFTSRRRILASPPPPPKCASINGISVPNNPEASGEQQVYSASGLLDRIRKWVGFLPSILPGGRWWEFSGDVDVQVVAQPVTVWRALGKMWDLVARDRWVIFAAFSALIVAAVSEISIPHFLTASIFSAQSADLAVFHRNVRLLVLLCVASGICSGIRGCFFGIANMILVKRMRETLYSSLLLQDISFFDNETVGDLTSRLGADCQQVSRVIGNDLNLIMRNVLQGGGSLIYLLILSWPLGLSTLVVCSILAAVMLRYGRYQKKAARLIQEVTASANDVAQETFSLIRTVRVYGTEEEEHGRYKWWLEKLADISLRQSAAYGVWNFSFNILYHSTQASVVQHVNFVVHPGEVVAIVGLSGSGKSTLVNLLLRLYEPTNGQIPNSTSNLSDNRRCHRRRRFPTAMSFFFLSSSPPLRHQQPHRLATLRKNNIVRSESLSLPLVNLRSNSSRCPLRLLMTCIVPDCGFDFGFRFYGEVVGDVDVVAMMEEEPGRRIRLFGGRMMILIDDIPLKDLDIMWWRERIGFVGQEPKLFRMDISSNIRYGCTQDVKQKDIEWAAKQAYAHNFISALPNGYETLVDDDLLSGGQKQRIAIARALLRDPKILILDEATSALDAESEHNVKGVLRSVRSDSATRSVIVIAHRLSTIQAADRIVVMDGGEIVEMGSHRELLLKDGLYARLTRKQADAMA